MHGWRRRGGGACASGGGITGWRPLQDSWTWMPRWLALSPFLFEDFDFDEEIVSCVVCMIFFFFFRETLLLKYSPPR